MSMWMQQRRVGLRGQCVRVLLQPAVDQFELECGKRPSDLAGSWCAVRSQRKWDTGASGTSQDSAVALLALDRNDNGVIDDGSELFGTATRKRDGTLAKNGFDALAEFDLNGDGKIDERDAVYSRLRLWIDAN